MAVETERNGTDTVIGWLSHESRAGLVLVCLLTWIGGSLYLMGW